MGCLAAVESLPVWCLASDERHEVWEDLMNANFHWCNCSSGQLFKASWIQLQSKLYILYIEVEWVFAVWCSTLHEKNIKYCKSRVRIVLLSLLVMWNFQASFLNRTALRWTPKPPSSCLTSTTANQESWSKPSPDCWAWGHLLPLLRGTTTAMKEFAWRLSTRPSVSVVPPLNPNSVGIVLCV